MTAGTKPGRLRPVAACAAAALIGLGTACQESLPSYRTPSGVFSLTLRADQPDLQAVTRDLDQVAAGKGGLGFSMDLKNVFDETLADTVREPLGSLQIWWRTDPSVTITIPLSRLDEIMTHEIGWDGVLVLDPGDSLRLADVCRSWEDDRGVPVWTYPAGAEITSEGIVYPPMDMAAQARVQPFDRAPAATSNIVTFRMVFVKKYQ
jgi:hypothetical protein